jgi:hypothetical protein
VLAQDLRPAPAQDNPKHDGDQNCRQAGPPLK